MNRNELKQLLNDVQDDFKVPQPDLIAIEALNYIGDSDPVFRDDLVLSFLITVIDRKDIGDEKVKEILMICLDNIFYQIEEMDDSVFTRTFSIYVIYVCLVRHMNSPFLTPSEIKMVFEKVIKAYLTDKDVRGYIEGKGWAHGAAHGADTLAQLALLQEVDEKMQLTILNALQEKTMIDYYGYIHNEDGRMSKVVLAILNRKILPKEELFKWLDGFRITKERNVAFIIKKSNVKHFLSSLYFAITEEDIRLKIEEIIKNNDNQ